MKKTVGLIMLLITATQYLVVAQSPGSCSTLEGSYTCGSGPGGCNVAIETYIVNIPRDNDDRPQSPFVYNIPNDPTNGQFKVIARYRTRDDIPGAAADGVEFNGVAGTMTFIEYGNDSQWAQNFSAEFTSGNVSTLTLDIDSEEVDDDNLPGLEVLVFKCVGSGSGEFAAAYVDERAWVGNGNGQPFCVTRTICLPGGSCNQQRELTIKSGIFNVHQGESCDREVAMRYVTNTGQTFTFLEVPPENNSTIEHTITVDAATESIAVSMCTWDGVSAGSAYGATCKGVSSIFGATVVSDACESCSVTCTNPTATASATNATCNGGTANSDASITIAGFTAGQRYQYTTGGTFTSGSATPASITAIPSGGVVVNNLPNATATFTVRIYDTSDDNCFVDRVVTTTVQDCTIPCNAPTPTAQDAERCSEGTVTLTASGCTTGFTATWYTESALTNQVNTGNSFTTPILSSTTSYWVACVEDANTTCKSTGVEAIATIKPLPTISNDTPVCAADGLTFEVTYTASAGAVVTANRGTVDTGNNKVTGVPSGETVTITATLDGCEANATATATCAIPCPQPNCGTVTVIKN